MKQIKLKISGMTCAACSASIERSLRRKDFIEKIEVDLVSESAFIIYDDTKGSVESIIAFIAKLGYFAEIFRNQAKEKRQNNDYIIAICFAIPLFLVSMGAMIADFSGAVVCIIEMILLLPILYAGFNIYAKGLNALIKCVPNMDSLVFLGSFSAIIYSVYMIFDLGLESPHLVHNLYFESAGVIIAVIMLGKKLEQIATNNAKSGIESLLNLTPKTALKQVNGEILEVALDSLKVNDTIIIPKGRAFSVDSTLVSQSCIIDDSVITGESLPKQKLKGDLIYSGSINKGEQILAKVENLACDSMISKIIALMQNVKKAPIARIADNISAYFVPSVICIALVAGIAWYVASGDLHKAFVVFTSTMLISCPCALGLATPLSILVATHIASKRAFYFKNAESLENAAKIKTMIFDKTGTLTSGDLEVIDFIESPTFAHKNAESFAESHSIKSAESKRLTKSEIFAFVYAIESKSEHLLAKAILKYTKNFAKNLEATSVETFAGQGISGIVENKSVKVGTLAFINQALNTPEIPHTACFVALDDEVVGYLIIADKIRQNAKNLIANLRSIGIKSIILSGDSKHSVEIVAESCGISDFHHSQLPQDKLNFIKDLQEQMPTKERKNHIVGFVGDGINDVLALSQADIGIALSESSDIAIKQSDIILLNNDLDSIYTAIDLSKKTLKNIKQNLAFAFIYNICAIPLAVGIPQIFGIDLSLNPMIAGIAMGLSSISVVLNAMRLQCF